MLRKLVFGCVAFFSAVSSTALAHEGHGVAGHGQSASHYITEPVHSGQIALLVAVVVCGALFAAKRMLSRPAKAE